MQARIRRGVVFVGAPPLYPARVPGAISDFPFVRNRGEAPLPQLVAARLGSRCFCGGRASRRSTVSGVPPPHRRGGAAPTTPPYACSRNHPAVVAISHLACRRPCTESLNLPQGWSPPSPATEVKLWKAPSPRILTTIATATSAIGPRRACHKNRRMFTRGGGAGFTCGRGASPRLRAAAYLTTSRRQISKRREARLLHFRVGKMTGAAPSCREGPRPDRLRNPCRLRDAQ